MNENDNNNDGGGTNNSTHPRNRWRCMQPRLCNYCWKTFSNSFNLKQHIVNVHIQSQGVSCSLCDKVVKNKWYLRKHLVTAHGAPLKRVNNSTSAKKEHEELENKTNDDQPNANRLSTTCQTLSVETGFQQQFFNYSLYQLRDSEQETRHKNRFHDASPFNCLYKTCHITKNFCSSNIFEQGNFFHQLSSQISQILKSCLPATRTKNLP